MARAATTTRRADSQARTRQLVLEAAERLFVANGFGATSLDDIAREAGFSKGAVYSNFAGKADLFFAIVEQQFDELRQRLRSAVEAEDDALSRLAAVGTWYQEFLRVESGWARSLPEVAALAAQDDDARQRFSSLLQSIESSITELTAQQQESLGIQFGLPPDQVAALVVALVMGLAVRSLHDLESPPELFNTALARFLLPI
ncbi:MAG TPA: TetR/AcrR family transcriptional regulator [Acidimicrobiales bacterium]|nr:TetR/AcrR family transcriptional regulator [Acidimicrobiales bacterium]